MLIDYRQIQNYAKKIERSNLKVSGESLTWVTILNRARGIVLEDMGQNVCRVPDDWKIQLWRASWKEVTISIAKVAIAKAELSDREVAPKLPRV